MRSRPFSGSHCCDCLTFIHHQNEMSTAAFQILFSAVSSIVVRAIWNTHSSQRDCESGVWNEKPEESHKELQIRGVPRNMKNKTSKVSGSKFARTQSEESHMSERPHTLRRCGKSSAQRTPTRAEIHRNRSQSKQRWSSTTQTCRFDHWKKPLAKGSTW